MKKLMLLALAGMLVTASVSPTFATGKEKAKKECTKNCTGKCKDDCKSGKCSKTADCTKKCNDPKDCCNKDKSKA